MGQSDSDHVASTADRIDGWRDFGLPILLGVVVLFAALLASSFARAQGTTPHLIRPATVADEARYARAARRADLGVARQRPVALDLSRLDDAQKAATNVLLELFDGRVVTLVKERVERRSGSNYTWHGKVLGYPNSFAVLTIVDGNVSGTVDTGERGASGHRYQIQTGVDGIPLLREIDAGGFPEDHPNGNERLAPATELKSKIRVGADGTAQTTLADGTIAKADTAATIDVMIVFSNQSAAAAGSGMAAQAQQAVDTANLVYSNSGITTRLRLVYAGPADYDESGDFNTDLSRLTSGTDGYMDNVASLRDAYGADLVSMFVENGQYCGMGWIGPNAAYAFTVVNRGCASGNLSYPHELGHNFGARHDTYVDSATTPYAYGHGWVDVAEGWRDVMAYNNACAASGKNCTRIPYLSNPNVVYGNPPDPTGSASIADTARVHNQNALTVANFRASKQGGSTTCTWSLSSSGSSVSSAAGNGSVGVTTQSGCAWNATSNASWLIAGTSSSGSGTLSYSFDANMGPARSGTLTIGGVGFNVSQASGCTYALNATSTSMPQSGGSGSVTLSTASACSWSVASSATWLTVTSAGSGSGSATVTYAVAANGGAARSANLTIGNQTFLVTQAAATSGVAAPVATLSPTSMDFGSIVVGRASSAKTATLTNTGGGTLTVASMTWSGANAPEFTLGGTCGINTSLVAGRSCTISVTFRPFDVGVRSASLGVVTSNGSVGLNVVGTGKKLGKK